MIEVKGLKKSFNGNVILDGLDIKVNKGDVISIIGPSGSGKTTILRCLNFLTKADAGELTFDSETFDLAAIDKKDVMRLRKKTGFVFQNFNLFANRTALGNVAEGLIVSLKMQKEEATRISEKMLRKVGMESKKDSYPSELSGGQQQRVAIARALAMNPEIIYFDEPTSALDPETIGEVLSVIRELANEGMTMLIVTHEMNFAKSVSNHVIFMEKGKIVEQGSPSELFEHPRQQRTREFLNSYNKEE